MLFALASLELWQRSLKALENLKWGQPAELHEEFPFGGEPQTPIWNWAAGESERAFRQRHRFHYPKAVEQYTAMVTEEIRRRGWIRTP
jgi:hypothetical protein